ncbi:DUF2645 family protein [Gilliamella apicola]|uniref:DUF2645 family protein n=1 Tax=unclassified Gilliamella TaxID=2685620 RepID=UPI000B2AFAB3
MKKGILSFIYFVLLLIIINLFSTDKYEWMIFTDDPDNFCTLPLGGRNSEDVFLILTIPLILSLFFIKNRKIRYIYLSLAILYCFWSFFLRFQWC